jgi:hypothetical protein
VTTLAERNHEVERLISMTGTLLAGEVVDKVMDVTPDNDVRLAIALEAATEIIIMALGATFVKEAISKVIDETIPIIELNVRRRTPAFRERMDQLHNESLSKKLDGYIEKNKGNTSDGEEEEESEEEDTI